MSQARNPALIAAIRAEAVTSLVEMARWQSPGHALPALWLLGRIGNLSDDEIGAAWSWGDRDRLIAGGLGQP